MGGSITGGTPIAGWFILYMGKSEIELDDEQGYPHFWKPPYDSFTERLSLRSKWNELVNIVCVNDLI